MGRRRRRHLAGDCGGGDATAPDGRALATACFLHRIEADTFEEAAAVHAIKMGWGAYHPSGEAAPCPHCGRMYDPKGSGECANCGPVR